MLEDSLSFPQTADDWVQTVVIGGVLSLLGVFILPSIVIQGYLVRVIRAAAEGDSAPSFVEWGELLVDGLRLFVLQFAMTVLLAVPFVVVFAFAGFFGGVTGSEAVAGVLVLLGVLVVGLLALVAGYFVPAAVANFAIEDSLAAALDVDTIAEGALTSDYAMAWLLALVVGFVGGLVGGALSIVLVGIFVLFYVQVVVYYLFGRGFAMGLGTDAGADEDGETGRSVGESDGDDRSTEPTATDRESGDVTDADESEEAAASTAETDAGESEEPTDEGDEEPADESDEAAAPTTETDAGQDEEPTDESDEPDEPTDEDEEAAESPDDDPGERDGTDDGTTEK